MLMSCLKGSIAPATHLHPPLPSDLDLPCRYPLAGQLPQWQTSSSGAAQQLAEWYADRPWLRALVQLASVVPGPAAIDVFLAETVDKIRQQRARTFFDELGRGENVLTPELIGSEDFLHAYFATANAALGTRRRTKIRWFARLLLSAVGDNAIIDLSTEYDDYLSLLDELSYRELGMLSILAAFEAEHPKGPDENDLQRATRFWDGFARTGCSTVAIPADELDALLTRLNRTGTYETFVGAYLDYTGGKGKLTPTYFRLADAIRVKAEDFDDEAP
jgi:hypothetical protein